MDRAADVLFQGQGVHLCGHRGHSIQGCENTVESFIQARDFGATLVETDIRLTADDEFVVFHDAILDDASRGFGPVRAKTMTELKNIEHKPRPGREHDNSRDRPEKLRSLNELLETARDLKLGLILEIKDMLRDQTRIKKVIQAIDDTQMRENVLLSSFDHTLLKYAKEEYPHTSTFGIVHTRHVSPSTIALEAGLDVYSVDYPRFHVEDGSTLRAAGVHVAQFLPKPEHFARGGDDHFGGLRDAVCAMKNGTMQILGVDDVSWGAKFLKENDVLSRSSDLEDVMITS